MEKILFIILLLFTCFSSNVYAYCSWSGNTCECPDATVSAIETCLKEIQTNTLGKTGTVILQLPADKEIWTDFVTVDMSSGYSGITELIIRGDGADPGAKKGSTGLTKITDYGFQINPHKNKKIRISNLTIGGISTKFHVGLITIDGPTEPLNGGGFRFDHITWDYPTGKSYDLLGGAYGVIDHNNGVSCFQFSATTDVGTYGNASWIKGSQSGSIYAVYFEDNELEFDGDCCLYSPERLKMFANGVKGSRIVIRHNILINYYLGTHDASTGYRGGLQYDIYKNKLISTHIGSTPSVFARGGTGVIYDNDFIRTQDDKGYFSGTSTGINFRNVRDIGGWTTTTWPGEMQVCGDKDYKAVLGVPEVGWGLCTSGENCIDIDGGPGTAYPCRDQIGTGDNAYPQSSMPYLIWNNRYTRANDDPVGFSVTSQSENILKDRDYCEDTSIDPPGTMPATCSGVKSTYVEFTYPHPLRNESLTVPSSPPKVELK